jgi:predicted site-specific integrase-resolvase
MARATADLAARTPAQRLRDALQELASSDAAEVPSATALCELAGVSRNALYRYHPDVLHELHKLQHRRHRRPAKTGQTEQRLRDENDELHLQVSKLAALVDHYFAAWQEVSSALQRRERELAELRRSVKPRLVALRK